MSKEIELFRQKNFCLFLLQFVTNIKNCSHNEVNVFTELKKYKGTSGRYIMTEENYYQEIEHLIKKNEISKRVRDIEANNSLVTTYWNVGRLIVEAQGGESRAKYGNELIKKWSIRLTNLYGKGYNASNLRKFRQFYLTFEKCSPLGSKLSWSHYRELLIFKDKNERNFYINLCIKHNLSKRKLIKEIKSKAYERLVDKPHKIDIIYPISQKLQLI